MKKSNLFISYESFEYRLKNLAIHFRKFFLQKSSTSGTTFLSKSAKLNILKSKQIFLTVRPSELALSLKRTPYRAVPCLKMSWVCQSRQRGVQTSILKIPVFASKKLQIKILTVRSPFLTVNIAVSCETNPCDFSN